VTNDRKILIAAILLILGWLLLFAWAAACDAASLQGVAVHYAPRWDLYAIAEIHGVTVETGHTPIAFWDCAALGRTGRLVLGGEMLPFKVVCGD
jgi:hypothetical protein